MARLPKSPVLSLCLVALAGYGAYVPFEKVHSAQIEAASQPMAINAVLPELQSRSKGVTSHQTEATASLTLEGERVVETTDQYLVNLNDKNL